MKKREKQLGLPFSLLFLLNCEFVTQDDSYNRFPVVDRFEFLWVFEDRFEMF